MGSHNSFPLESSIFVDTRSPLQSMWDLTIHRLRGPASLLVHRLMCDQSMWDLTIHHLGGLASLLAHRAPPSVRPINVGSHNSSLRGQTSLVVHRALALIPFINVKAQLTNIVLFGLSLADFSIFFKNTSTRRSFRSLVSAFSTSK